jgi:hypothetical protein
MSFWNGESEEVLDSGFDPLPAGEYRVLVEEATGKPTKAGNGRYINVQYTVVDGRYTKRKLFHKFNTENPSEQARKIGRSVLKRFLHAVGLGTQRFETEIEMCRAVANKTLYITVGVRKDNRTGEDENHIKMFGKKEEQLKSTGAPTPPPAKAAAGLPNNDVPF